MPSTHPHQRHVRNDRVEGPIVLAGQAHAGKTPLRLALETHPEVTIHRHADAWLDLRRRFPDLSRPSSLRRVLAAIEADPTLGGLVIDRSDLLHDLEGGPGLDQLLGHVHRQHARAAGKRRWGIQLGFAELIAPAMLEAFPGCRVVHMVRAPAAQLAFGSRTPGSLGWRAAKWVESTQAGIAARTVDPRRYLIVRHEDLQRHPAATLAGICAFVELDCLPVMVTALERALPSKQVVPTMPASDVCMVNRLTGAAAEAVGYPPVEATGGVNVVEAGAAMAWRWASRRRIRHRGRTR